MSINTGDYVCIFSDYTDIPGDEALLALLYSKYFNKRFCVMKNLSCLDNFLSGDTVTSVFVFLPYDRLDLTLNFKLFNKYRKQTGYLPYVDKYSISSYFRRRVLFCSRPESGYRFLMVNRIKQENDKKTVTRTGENETYYFPRAECMSDSLSPILHPDFKLLEFNYISHCRECTILMNDFLYCGLNQGLLERKSPAPGEDKDKFLPCCHMDSSQCYLDGKIKHNASNLNMPVYFLNGCNLGDLNRSVVPYRYTVVANILENSAVSILTSPGIKVGDIAENILAHNLLKYGYTEGEKLYYLNQFLLYSKIDNNLYFQLGDPAIRLNSRAKDFSNFDYSKYRAEADNIQDDSYLEVNIDAHSVDNGIFLDEICFLDAHGAVQNEDAAVFYGMAAPPAGNSVKFMLFAREKFNCSRIVIQFTSHNPIEEKVFRLESYNRSLGFYKEHFILDSGTKGKIIDIQNNLKAIYPLLKRYRFCCISLNKLKGSLKSLENKFNQVFREVFLKLFNYTAKNLNNFFEDMGEKRTNHTPVSSDSTCIDCGYPDIHLAYEIFSFEHKINRHSYRCYHCGSVRDVPDSSLDFCGSANLRFSSGGSDLALYEITNRHEAGVHLHIAAICIDTKEIDILPAISEVCLERDEKFHLKLNIRPRSNLRKNYFLFSIYIMADGKFYYISKMLDYA